VPETQHIRNLLVLAAEAANQLTQLVPSLKPAAKRKRKQQANLKGHEYLSTAISCGNEANILDWADMLFHL
jgi:hypothetical protein